MPTGPVCPSAAELQRFLLGQVAQPDADTLEQHLEQCVPCQQALASLEVTDGLVQTARAVAGRPGFVAHGTVENLMDRLARLSMSRTGGTHSGGTAAASEADPDLHALLAPPQAPGEIGRLGPYRILGVLGSGGMGVVFRAEDAQLGRHVALKVIRPRLAASATARERFLRKARTAAAIEHDHIVPLYHVGEDRGVPFLAFQLLKGESLDDRLNRSESLPIPEIVRIGREIAQGLAAAHGRGLMHRDIKPANIWLEGAGGRVRILDFGLARAVAEVQERLEPSDVPTPGAGLTHTGAVLGTPAYMAPEQARGGTVDARADLFSLGAVLYRMATGRVPFSGSDATAVLAAVQQEQPAPPRLLNPKVPARLSRLILALLAKMPAQRPASASAIVESLAAMQHRRQRRWWPLAAAGLLATLLAVAAYLARPNPDDAEPNRPTAPSERSDPAEIAGVEFVPGASYDTGLNPGFVAVGDLNGDGKADLVVVNAGARLPKTDWQSTVSVLLGNGDGTFRPAVHYATGIFSTAALIADLNGDGKADIVVVNQTSQDGSARRATSACSWATATARTNLPSTTPPGPTPAASLPRISTATVNLTWP